MIFRIVVYMCWNRKVELFQDQFLFLCGDFCLKYYVRVIVFNLRVVIIGVKWLFYMVYLKIIENRDLYKDL